MKKAKKIHGIDTLEREIYRLQLEAKNIEQKLDHNLDHFHENYWSMALKSVTCKNDGQQHEKNGFWTTFLKHEGFNSVVNAVAGNIVKKAAEGLRHAMNDFFEKNVH